MKPSRLAIVSLVILGCSRHEEPANPAPQEWTIGSGWRAAVDRDPSILTTGCTDAWVSFWQNDYLKAFKEFQLAGDSDEALAGAARTLLAVAGFLRVAGHAQVALEIEAGEYRMDPTHRIEVGRYTPLFLGWAQMRAGNPARARELIHPPWESEEDRAIGEKVLAGAMPGAVTPPPWSGRTGRLDLSALVAAVPCLRTEAVKDGVNEATLCHRDPDALLAASLAAYRAVLDLLKDKGGGFNFFKCEAAIAARDASLAQATCTKALEGDTVPWWVFRLAFPETEEDVRVLTKARAQGLLMASLGAKGLPTPPDGSAMAPFVLRDVAFLSGPGGLDGSWLDPARRLAAASLARVRGLVGQLGSSWTGPGGLELKRMQAAERLGAEVAAAAAQALLLWNGPLDMVVPGLESVYAPARDSFVDPRHSPEYLVTLAWSYFATNRFSEGIGILRQLEVNWPIVGTLREVAEVISVQRSLDTRGTARRE